mgnify:CR=1 FL=1
MCKDYFRGLLTNDLKLSNLDYNSYLKALNMKLTIKKRN